MRTTFDAEDWIERLAVSLPRLAEAQEPYLEEYRRRHPRTREIVYGSDVTSFSLEDARMVYWMARYARRFGEEAEYAPLRQPLDQVRHALLAHPAVERVAVTGRLIGDNDFWMRILDSGWSISAGNLIAGLMARAAELPGDRFRTAARELDAFLSPVGDREAGETLGGLDEGCDMVLFYGLAATERIDVRKDMAILPYGDTLRFVDEKHVQDFAPSGAGFHDWRGVGAVVRPFRWRPAFRRGGGMDGPSHPRGPYFPAAAVLLDLLAVSHMTAVVPLAALSGRIDGAAGRLLGRDRQSLGIYRSWRAEGIDGFAECPELTPEAIEDIREVFENRENDRYRRLAHIVVRLARALVRDGRFADQDKVLDVAIALEGMYDLPKRGVTKALGERVARYLGTDAESQDRIRENVTAFYNARSAIVHGRSGEGTPFTNGAAFMRGFDLARGSLFKMLREGMPDGREWPR